MIMYLLVSYYRSALVIFCLTNVEIGTTRMTQRKKEFVRKTFLAEMVSIQEKFDVNFDFTKENLS